MSSASPTDARWSLTRRLAVLSALASCAMVALYAVWSAYYVFANMRGDLNTFLEHETSELALDLERSDGTDEAVAELVADIAEVSEDPACAFRVRDASRRILAESGEARLLESVTRPIEPGSSWRQFLWSAGVVTASTHETRHDLVVEVLVDAEGHIEKITSFLVSASLAFLVAAAGAGLLSWLTARRGVAGLSAVVAQAGAIGLSGGMRRIRVENAPDEIRDVASALNDMIDRIDAGMESMRTFTAGLAHELRSPLQNLIGETEVALLADRPSDEYRQLLASNLEDLHDLSDAVDNLVAFCRRAEPARDALRRHAFDLASEAELRLERERRAAERLGVRLEVVSEGDTVVVADREAALRVVRNLVGNAIDWSPEGGTVTVLVQGTPDVVRFVVEDDGPGVPADLGPRIFEPFVSGPPRPRQRSGYGLGLAICKSIVDEHGGSLSFENRGRRGARFVASFPRGASPSGVVASASQLSATT